MTDPVYEALKKWPNEEGPLCDEEGCNEVAVTERKPSGWLYFYCREHAEKFDQWQKEYRRQAYRTGR